MSAPVVDIHLKVLGAQRSAGSDAAKGKGDQKPAASKEAVAAPAEPEDKLVLEGGEKGKVVTRFPPEASGFLHIGHAKAALVNSMLRDKYEGKMVFRFDDTNPDKERHEFEIAIQEDLKTLGVTWDVGPTYSSGHFDTMLKYADQLLDEGLAYCDDTEKEVMQKQRFDGVASKCRDQTIEKNKEMWSEMKNGTEFGQTCCLRAKMSVDADNKALRDPVIYRVNLNPHPRTGRTYNVYPTYDFCCPIVDAVEGVTHALRTTEYHDRNDQYYWFIDKLKLRKPVLEDFSRLNMEYSLMSKRKLTQLVADGTVDGWDDPRFPTVRALVRRGLKIDALREFVKVQGMSKSVNVMEWSKLWNFNVQILDPSVARYTAVSGSSPCRCTVDFDGNLVPFKTLLHKKNEALGEKTKYRHNVVFLDAEDVLLLKENEEVTLMDWGNAYISGVEKNAEGLPVKATLKLHLEGDVKKTKYKLTWIPENPKAVKAVIHEYDHLLTKKKPDPSDSLESVVAKVTHYEMPMICEEAMSVVKKGDMFQLERRGYYICDATEPALSLIAVPDGKDKVNHLSAKAAWMKVNAPKKEEKKDELTLEEKKALKAAEKAAKKAAAAEKAAAKK